MLFHLTFCDMTLATKEFFGAISSLKVLLCESITAFCKYKTNERQFNSLLAIKKKLQEISREKIVETALLLFAIHC